MDSFSAYSFETGRRADPSWHVYASFLYPSDRDRQTIENGRVLDSLERHGDNHAKARPVSHWLYFKASQDRGAFVDAAVAAGFQVKETTENPATPGTPFAVTMVRNTSVEYSVINNEVHELYDLAVEHAGDYDGWETSVEK